MERQTVPEDLTAPTDPVVSYWTGQIQDSHAALFEAYQAESHATVAAFRPELDVRYGAHPREVFDVFRAAGPSRGVLVYYHGGYWQARDKAQFRFLAPAFLAEGIDVVLANYPLCPDVSLAALVASVRSGLVAVVAHMRGRQTDALVVAGHSAGGHLAAELALTDWRRHGLVSSPIAAVLPISGVYELTPLLRTALNDKLGLDAVSAAAMSPLRRVWGALPPAAFIAGSAETAAFQAQSAQMHEAWRDAGAVSSSLVVPGADHYSLLRHFTPGHAAFEAALALFPAPR